MDFFLLLLIFKDATHPALHLTSFISFLAPYTLQKDFTFKKNHACFIALSTERISPFSMR